MTDPAVTETVIEQGKALVRAIEVGFCVGVEVVEVGAWDNYVAASRYINPYLSGAAVLPTIEETHR